jgi:septal ring factor EnvC (AmiA/AmiB activator)
MITKHGPAVKKAVGNLLEQGEPGQVPTEEDFSDEDFFADLDAEMSPGEASTPLAPTLSAQIPQAATEGDNLCPCPDKEAEVPATLDAIVFDFSDLEKEMDSQEDELMALEEGVRQSLTEEDKEDKEDKKDEDDDASSEDKKSEDDKDDEESDDSGKKSDKSDKSEDDKEDDSPSDDDSSSSGDKKDDNPFTEALMTEEDISDIVSRVTEEIKMQIQEVPHGHTGRLTAPEAEVWTDLQKAMATQKQETEKLKGSLSKLSEEYSRVRAELKESREAHVGELTKVAGLLEEMNSAIEGSKFENAKLSAIRS